MITLLLGMIFIMIGFGLVFVVMISPLLLLSKLIDSLLKRKIKPNEDYLKEIEEIKNIKVINNINTIIFFIIILFPETNSEYDFLIRMALLLIYHSITDLIRNKKAFDYLKTKDESDATLKYIIYNFLTVTIITILGLGLGLYYYEEIVNVFDIAMDKIVNIADKIMGVGNTIRNIPNY